MNILIEEKEGALWVAAMASNRLEGIEIDPVDEPVRWGSIYRARVETIDRAMDAAYVTLEQGAGQKPQSGILFNADVRIISSDGASVQKGGAVAIGKILQAGQIIIVQIKTIDNANIASQPYESKLPRVSMDIALPGRYLIHCPLMQGNRLSQRIRSKKLRTQIESMMDKLTDISGCILRSSAAHTQTEMLAREGRILKSIWEDMAPHRAGSSPALIMRGPDAVQRTLSDQAGAHIERIEVVTMDHFTMTEEWCTIFAPDLVTKINPIELPDAAEDMALFHHRDIMDKIAHLFQDYILLQGGGNIVLQPTSALTAIDVNRGADKNGHLAINLEAVQEIARQIRLRNYGGILMIDFLRMPESRDAKILLKAMDEAVQSDPCTVQIHGMTKLGLMEISRKRRTPTLSARAEGIF
jgi:Rne/Rng family ribonuclease